MKRIYNNLTELIGNTPSMVLSRYAEVNCLKSKIIAKLEMFNPAGSVKDRVAYAMIIDAEKKGILKKGDTIIEPTSGNTGIGLAFVAAARGYKTMLTMPETMSVERRNLLKAYGAEVVLTEGALGMEGSIVKARELLESIPGSVMLSQFTNQANPNAHLQATGPEIWEDTGGEVDIFVAGVGTGGTITGIGEYLKSQKKDIDIVAVEPFGSSVLSGGKKGSHGLQGIGAGFIPEVLLKSIYDEVIAVKDEDAFTEMRKLQSAEGLFVGISSGAALWAAAKIASREENTGKTIVVLFPDSIDKYISIL